MTVAVAGLVIAGVTAYSQYKEGKSQKKSLYNQAEHKKLEGRVESLKAKQQGIIVLKKTNEAWASVNAQAYAGGLEPNIGTTADILNYSVLNPGFNDFITSKDNEYIITSQFKAQAEDLRYQGRQASKKGSMKALATMGTAMASYGATGSAPSGGTGGPYVSNSSASSPGGQTARYGNVR